MITLRKHTEPVDSARFTLINMPAGSQKYSLYRVWARMGGGYEISCSKGNGDTFLKYCRVGPEFKNEEIVKKGYDKEVEGLLKRFTIFAAQTMGADLGTIDRRVGIPNDKRFK